MIHAGIHSAPCTTRGGLDQLSKQENPLRTWKRVLCSVVNDDKKGVPSTSGVVPRPSNNLERHLLEHFAGPKRTSGWRTTVAFLSVVFTTSQYLWSIHRPASRPSIDNRLGVKSWADGLIWPSRPILTASVAVFLFCFVFSALRSCVFLSLPFFFLFIISPSFLLCMYTPSPSSSCSLQPTTNDADHFWSKDET